VVVAYVLLALVGVIGLVAVIWRVGSRRHSVPCPVWLRWLVELDSPFTKTNRAAVIVERLDLQPGMAVLDAGCGPGRSSASKHYQQVACLKGAKRAFGRIGVSAHTV
jgi:hypothetical protein